MMLIGSYTSHLDHVDGRGKGITETRFDPALGSISPPELVAQLPNPSWLIASRDGSVVYAVDESERYEGRIGGGVYAFHRKPTTARLELINSMHSEGTAPAHLSLDPTGRFLVVANYGSGSIASFELRDDGGLRRVADVVEHHGGSGVDPSRQSSSHPHQIVFGPNPGEMWVPDLGLDFVLIHRMDDRGRLSSGDVALVLPPGSGPRHMLIAPNGDSILVLGELDSSIAVFRRTASGFELTDRASTLAEPASAASGECARRATLAAALVATDDSRYVFASNRGDDTIAMFEWNRQRGSVRRVAVVPSEGRTPRGIAMSPEGRHLIVANQDSDTLVVFRVSSSGLAPIGQSRAISPACVLFGPEASAVARTAID